VVALLLAIRIALPHVVRATIESRANAAIAGTLHVGDVDLWLLRGAVALEDVTFRADGATPDGPPTAAFSRLYVNLSWFSLLRRNVRLQAIELERPFIHVERSKGGEITLPALRPGEGGQQSAPGPEPEATTPWNVTVDRAVVRHGQLDLVDRVPEPEEVRRLELEEIELDGFSLRAEPEATPGAGLVEARFGDGSMRLGVSLERNPEGFVMEARLEAANIPLDRLQVHRPELGWSGFAGRLDADVQARIAPGALPIARGTVTLRDVAIEVPGVDRPVLGWRRIEVEADAVDVTARKLVLARIDIDGPLVEVQRTKFGAVVLPVLPAPAAVPTAKPADSEPPATATATLPWDVSVGRATLTQGDIRLVDRAVDVAQTVDLEIEGLTLAGFTLRRSEDRKPGEGEIEARFGEGSLKIGTHFVPREQGVAIDATLELEDVPLDRLYVHVPELGWSDFHGRLDGQIAVALEPAVRPKMSGRLSLRDLEVQTPDESAPVLRWRRLDVEAETIDLAARHAALKRVALDGASFIARPRASVPLPLLAGITRARADSAEPVTPSPSEAPPLAPQQTPQWTWSIATIEISDSGAQVELEPPPLEVSVPRARVTGLSSRPEAPVEVDAEVSSGGGTVAVRGVVTREPFAVKVATRIDELAIGPLLEAVGGAPVRLAHGAASGEVTLDLADGNLAASGKLALGDLELVPREGKDFSTTWKRLEIDVRKLEVPGAAATPPPSAPGTTAAAKPVRPIQIDLDRVRLVAPSISLTRVAGGLLLPGSAGAAPAEGASNAGTPPAAGMPPSSAGTSPSGSSALPLRVQVGGLDVEDGVVGILDRTVQPFYRGRITRVNLRVRSLRFPEASFQNLTLDARLPGGASLTVRGEQSAKGAQIEAKLDGLPLAQFNPYVVAAAGYSIASGSATVSSSAWWGPTYYQAWNDLAFDDLDLAGVEGDTIFAQQFGVPLSLALGLLRSPGGRISLGVPIEGDRERGARIDLKPVVAEAIAKALLGAIISPLKLIGAVALGGGKVEAVQPAAIDFDAGGTEISDDGWWRLGELAGALGSYPGLRLTLRGSAGGEDLRALQEAAVLGDLERDQGVMGTLRGLGSLGDRSAVREYLAARAARKPAELADDRKPALERWVAEKAVGDEDLRALAAGRAERLQALLENDYGVGAKRLARGEPVIARDGGHAEVVVSVGAGH
jgi:hypothetical protein